MAYIGTKPTIGNFQICDAISVVNGQAAYTMQVGSVNVIPQSANHMIVSLNGTIQKPNSSFTVSGSTITFASNLATCLLYTSPSPRDRTRSRMPSSA